MPEDPTNNQNPWHPYRDAWDKQAKETPEMFETSREWHDHLSALTGKLPTREERPLVSLGQGEYRRDIMAEDC